MHTLLILLKTNPTQTVLRYKEAATALEALNDITEACEIPSRVRIRDDYSHICHLDTADVSLAIYANVKLEQEASAEHSILHARANKQLQDRAAADPVLNMVSAGKLQLHN